MEWLVGMDLSDRGQGALAYTSWLKQAMKAGEAEDRFLGVHVLEEAVSQPLLRHHDLEQVEKSTEQAASAIVEGIGDGFSFDEQRVVHGRSAEATLGDLSAAPEVRGLILGRQAKRGERRIVRLGRVARRLLRSLPAPIVVVPPDLRRPNVGKGPVLLAVDTDAEGEASLAFAQKIAADLGRPLAVAHVISLAEYLVVDPMLSGMSGDLMRQLHDKHEHRLGVWMQLNGLHDVPSHVVEGPVVDGLAQIAAEQESPLIVCGSRGLGLGLRLFTSSVASDLAGACEVPVAVVPDPVEPS